MPGKSNGCPAKGKQRVENSGVYGLMVQMEQERDSRDVRPAVEEIEEG